MTGDTYPVRAELKKMGLWFDRKARGNGAWVMRSGYNDHPEHPKEWGVDEKKLKDTLKKVQAFAKDYNAQLAADNAEKLTGAGLKDDPYVKGKLPPRKLMKRIMSMDRGNKRLKKHGIVVTYEFPSDHGGALGGITGASTAWVVGDTFKVKDELKKMGFRFNRSVPSEVEERAKKEGVKKVQAGWSMDGATYDRIERSFIERLIRAIEGTLGESVELDEAVDMGKFKGLSSKGKQLVRSVGPTEILHGEPGEIIIGKDVDDGPELARWVRRELPGKLIWDMKSTGYVSKEDAGKGPWALLYKGGLPKLAPGYKGPMPSWAK